MSSLSHIEKRHLLRHLLLLLSFVLDCSSRFSKPNYTAQDNYARILEPKDVYFLEKLLPFLLHLIKLLFCAYHSSHIQVESDLVTVVDVTPTELNNQLEKLYCDL